jgi:hypothetical protein
LTFGSGNTRHSAIGRLIAIGEALLSDFVALLLRLLTVLVALLLVPIALAWTAALGYPLTLTVWEARAAFYAVLQVLSAVVHIVLPLKTDQLLKTTVSRAFVL